jgi:uncharacterized protein YndB with AHSA1/START domain
MNNFKLNQLSKVVGLLLITVIFFACSDDDTKITDPKDLEGTSEYVLTDSVKTWQWFRDPQALDTYWMSRTDLENGKFNFLFGNWAQGFVVQIEADANANGKTIDLTKKQDDDDMPWFVEITYIQAEFLNITGEDDDLSSKIKSGSTLYIKTLNKDKHLYEVRLNLILSNDDNIKINFKG